MKDRILFLNVGGFPETVQVAVGEGCDGFVVLGHDEMRFRRVAGIKFFSLPAALGLQVNPVNLVFVRHGVAGAADFDDDFVAFSFDDRHVFFRSATVFVHLQFFHFFAAAHHGHAGVMDHPGDVAADFAYDKFSLLVHAKSSFTRSILPGTTRKFCLWAAA